jgi:ABC-type oligopeptide transport system ATPase subunit
MVIVRDGIDRRQSEKIVAGARNAIELKSVAKEYKAPGGGVFRAVAEVDLEVAEGEFVALVGPSGCGETARRHCFA